MPENNTDRWMEVAKWAGESETAIKGLNREIAGLRKDIKCLEGKVDKLSGRLTGVQVKLATMSGTVAILVTLLTVFITNGLGM